VVGAGDIGAGVVGARVVGSGVEPQELLETAWLIPA